MQSGPYADGSPGSSFLLVISASLITFQRKGQMSSFRQVLKRWTVSLVNVGTPLCIPLLGYHQILLPFCFYGEDCHYQLFFREKWEMLGIKRIVFSWDPCSPRWLGPVSSLSRSGASFWLISTPSLYYMPPLGHLGVMSSDGVCDAPSGARQLSPFTNI